MDVHRVPEGVGKGRDPLVAVEPCVPPDVVVVDVGVDDDVDVLGPDAGVGEAGQRRNSRPVAVVAHASVDEYRVVGSNP